MEKLIEIERTDPDKSPKINSQSILQSICTGELYGQVIGKIASSLQYTSVDTRIIELADVLNRRGVLNRNEDIAAVGVVDRQGSTLGLIDRRELFGTLGRQFGRDIYSTKTVDKVMRQVKTYDQNRNIFSVADDLQEELHDTNTKYFLITRDDTQFAGIFSTKDLLVYLSKITQIDISMARKIQNQIVHEEQFVASSKFNLLASSRMAKGVGGDFYFLKEYSKGRWIIILCDVSGKGVSASLVTAVLGGMLEVYDFSQGIHKFIIKEPLQNARF